MNLFVYVGIKLNSRPYMDLPKVEQRKESASYTARKYNNSQVACCRTRASKNNS